MNALMNTVGIDGAHVQGVSRKAGRHSEHVCADNNI